MKKCPFCAEEIQDEAVKCKHCGEMIEVKSNKVKTSIVPFLSTAVVCLAVYFLTVYLGNSKIKKSYSQEKNRISTVTKKANETLKVADVYAEQILERAFYNRPGEIKGWGFRINELRDFDYKDLMEQLYNYKVREGTPQVKWTLRKLVGFDNMEPIFYILNNYQEWKELRRN